MSRAKRDGEATRPAKHPRSMWVVLRDGVVVHYPFGNESAAVLRAHPTLDTVVRYDLHRPAKAKAKKAKGGKRG